MDHDGVNSGTKRPNPNFEELIQTTGFHQFKRPRPNNPNTNNSSMYNLPSKSSQISDCEYNGNVNQLGSTNLVPKTAPINPLQLIKLLPDPNHNFSVENNPFLPIPAQKFPTLTTSALSSSIMNPSHVHDTHSSLFLSNCYQSTPSHYQYIPQARVNSACLSGEYQKLRIMTQQQPPQPILTTSYPINRPTSQNSQIFSHNLQNLPNSQSSGHIVPNSRSTSQSTSQDNSIPASPQLSEPVSKKTDCINYNIGYKQDRQRLSGLPPLIKSVSDSTLDLNNTTILDYNNDSNCDLNSTDFDDRDDKDDKDDSSIISNSVIKHTNHHNFNPNQTNPFMTQYGLVNPIFFDFLQSLTNNPQSHSFFRTLQQYQLTQEQTTDISALNREYANFRLDQRDGIVLHRLVSPIISFGMFKIKRSLVSLLPIDMLKNKRPNQTQYMCLCCLNSTVDRANHFKQHHNYFIELSSIDKTDNNPSDDQYKFTSDYKKHKRSRKAITDDENNTNICTLCMIASKNNSHHILGSGHQRMMRKYAVCFEQYFQKYGLDNCNTQFGPHISFNHLLESPPDNNQALALGKHSMDNHTDNDNTHNSTNNDFSTNNKNKPTNQRKSSISQIRINNTDINNPAHILTTNTNNNNNPLITPVLMSQQTLTYPSTLQLHRFPSSTSSNSTSSLLPPSSFKTDYSLTTFTNKNENINPLLQSKIVPNLLQSSNLSQSVYSYPTSLSQPYHALNNKTIDLNDHFIATTSSSSSSSSRPSSSSSSISSTSLAFPLLNRNSSLNNIIIHPQRNYHNTTLDKQ
jgi:hypothetical protein